MPLILERSGEDFVLKVWSYFPEDEETLKSVPLTREEAEWLATKKAIGKRIEFLLVRKFLLSAGFQEGDLFYDAHGKPHLKSKGSIGISHSRNIIAVLLSSSPNCGLDIELMEDRIFRVAHKFVSDAEFMVFGQHPSRVSLYHIWCAKEAMYKFHGSGGLDFREHLRVFPIPLEGSGNFQGKIIHPDFQGNFEIAGMVHDEIMVVWIS